MTQHITVDSLRLDQVCDIPPTIEEREALHGDIRAALASDTYDGRADTPHGYRLRVDAEAEHGAMLHFPQHQRAVIVWSGSRRLMDYCPTWREAVTTFFGPAVEIVAGLGIRD